MRHSDIINPNDLHYAKARTFTGLPSAITPDFIDQILIETNSKKIYLATDTTQGSLVELVAVSEPTGTPISNAPVNLPRFASIPVDVAANNNFKLLLNSELPTMMLENPTNLTDGQEIRFLIKTDEDQYQDPLNSNLIFDTMYSFKEGSGLLSTRNLITCFYDYWDSKLYCHIEDVGAAFVPPPPPVMHPFTVNTSTNELIYTNWNELSGPTNWYAPVMLSNTGGSLPSPLLTGTTYYIVWPDSSNNGRFKLSAQSGSMQEIDISTVGTGQHFVFQPN